ncbi:MAG: DUF1127 domain-containing protein [Pseudomonadota bacterium]
MSTTTLHCTEITQSRSMHSTLNRIVAAVVRPVVQWLRKTRTEQTLSSLSDRELLDIGVDRSEITAVSERLAREQRERDIRKLGR